MSTTNESVRQQECMCLHVSDSDVTQVKWEIQTNVRDLPANCFYYERRMELSLFLLLIFPCLNVIVHKTKQRRHFALHRSTKFDRVSETKMKSMQSS